MSKHVVFLILLGSYALLAQDYTDLNTLLQLQNDIKAFTPQPLLITSNQELSTLRARFIQYQPACIPEHVALCQSMEQQIIQYESLMHNKQRNYLESLTKRKMDSFTLVELKDVLDLILIYRDHSHYKSFNELFQHGLERLGNMLKELDPTEIAHVSKDYAHAIIKADDLYVHQKKEVAVSALLRQTLEEKVK